MGLENFLVLNINTEGLKKLVALILMQRWVPLCIGFGACRKTKPSVGVCFEVGRQSPAISGSGNRGVWTVPK